MKELHAVTLQNSHIFLLRLTWSYLLICLNCKNNLCECAFIPPQWSINHKQLFAAHQHNLFPFVYPTLVTQSLIHSETNLTCRICHVVSLNIFCAVNFF